MDVTYECFVTYLSFFDRKLSCLQKTLVGFNHIFCFHVRYVGAIWFIFHVLQLLPIRSTQQNLCYINNPTLKHMQKPIEYWTSHDLVMVIGSVHMFKHVSLVCFLIAPPRTTYRSNIWI